MFWTQLGNANTFGETKTKSWDM